MAIMNRSLQVVNLGKKDFNDFYKINYRMWLQRLANDISDSLVFTEHPHGIIVGKKGNVKAIKFPYAVARREEIPVYEIDWDGGITYRGPGQLVIYPLLHLNRHSLGAEEAIRQMENVLVNLLRQYGIKGRRLPNKDGIWVDKCKIAYTDVEVCQHVTRHSLAINVNPRLSLFRMLQPWEDDGFGVTSMYHILKKKVDLNLLKSQFVAHFQREFGIKAENVSSF